MYSELVQRQITYNDDKVSEIFFSQNNIDTIQKMIQHNVYRKSGNKHKISKQSEPELFIIMNSIYKQHRRNLPNYIQEQIHELNNFVVEEATRLIMPRLLQYVDYMNNLDNRLDVMEHGQNTSSAGLKYYQV